MHTVNLILGVLSLWFAYVAWVFYKSIDGEVRVNLLCTFASLSWAFGLASFLFEMTDHIRFLQGEYVQVSIGTAALVPLLASMFRLVKFVNKKYPGSFLT